MSQAAAKVRSEKEGSSPVGACTPTACLPYNLLGNILRPDLRDVERHSTQEALGELFFGFLLDGAGFEFRGLGGGKKAFLSKCSLDSQLAL